MTAARCTRYPGETPTRRSCSGWRGSAIPWSAATTSSTRCPSCTRASEVSLTSSSAWKVHMTASATYEPVDAKLTRVEGKPGHVLQLCFYADALEALTGAPPREMHLWLGSGLQESLRVEQFRPYWRRLRRQLADLLNRDEIEGTRPEPCNHCDYCEFNHVCDARWREEDSLVYVANIRRPEWLALEAQGVRTVVELSSRRDTVPELHEESLARLRRQAALQVTSRERPWSLRPTSSLQPSDDPVFGHGFDLLPQRDDGDVFFDFEGHPFWTAQSDLFFLAGLYYRDEDGEWTYDARWAHDLDEQAVMIKELVEFFVARRASYPSMHVYHYNHTEKSSMERLTRGSESESLFTTLVETGLFVDLYVVVQERLSGRDRVLRSQVARAPHWFRPARRHRAGRRRGRRVRPVHDDQGSTLARGDRELQRGRRGGDDGASRLAARAPTGRVDVARSGVGRARPRIGHRRPRRSPEEIW